MVGWRTEELKQDKFTGRDDDRCVEYERDWRFLLDQDVLTDWDREELEHVLIDKFLSDTERRKIKHVLGEEDD